ncbi:isoleucine--tRNA ligase [Candidatus Uhrbacteria bacterium]|nr:isoleucine--tRNA ligase [Candidatus Uhrbacteria bacterium]
MAHVSDREKDILAFWDAHKIFEKSMKERPAEKPYVFYDGPPFATGLPHYGHIPSSCMKDAVPRYWTMRGYRVERVWGWDCHGLPIENIIEQQLKFKSKKDIEEYGIAKFNEACRATVLMYVEEWKKFIHRIGRWVDMEHAYKTMDVTYMESVWWVFSQLWKKGLIYEGKRPIHICPRCVTPVSTHEVAEEYKEITDISVTVKFKIKNAQEKLGMNGEVSLLAWTTTPWTLPGNVLLAIGKKIPYVALTLQSKETGEEETVIVGRDRVASYEGVFIGEYETIQEKNISSDQLEGLIYEPLFPYFKDTKNAFRVVSADFVTADDGTGIVHIAPAFGEDDYAIGEREKTGFVQHVAMDGTFTSEVTDFSGMQVKPKNDPTKTDREVVALLKSEGKILISEAYIHSYPHCWRCDTPLLNYAAETWFVRVKDMRQDLLKNNTQTDWVPAHMKDGRFGAWLEGARDWAISRNRFWGTPLPIWKSEDGELLCVGSIAELEAASGKRVTDLHKHIIDEIVIEKNGKKFTRIPEVLDCWFESGSMPYGQMHYPFENKEKFEAGFPAEFIAEGQDQTRGWFYSLHVLATALTRGESPAIPMRGMVPAFKHVIVNGIVLAQDGKKMSKRLKNYPDPNEMVEKYGADALRYYILSSPVIIAEDMNFSEQGLRETYNKIINTLYNVLQFYLLFPVEHIVDSNRKPSKNILDRWILSLSQKLIQEITDKMNEYKLGEAIRPIEHFISELSGWYIRRSRDRFKGDDGADKIFAQETLAEILHTLAKGMAPFTPFIAEEIYQEVARQNKKESVHLEEWPVAKIDLVDDMLERQMQEVREIVETVHALRARAGIKVRQPLGELVCTRDLDDALYTIIAEEVNVKHARRCADLPGGDDWAVHRHGECVVALNTFVTRELALEGLYREFVRQVNAQRKTLGLTVRDRVGVQYISDDSDIHSMMAMHHADIQRSILASEVFEEKTEEMIPLEVNGKKIFVKIYTTSV